MNFQLDAEQQLLQDSVRRFAGKATASGHGEAFGKQEPGNDACHWERFAEQGWLAAALPEAHGGLGGSVVDTALISQELGRGLVAGPYLGCAVLAAQTIAAAAIPAQRDHLLPSLADGTRRIALAYGEAESFGDPAMASTQAVHTGDGYRLDGCKTLVLGAPGADAFVVSARLPRDSGAASDIALFLVNAGNAGMACAPWPLHDGSWAGQITLDGVRVGEDALLGTPGNGLTALRHGLAHAVAALGAELVGAMEMAIDLTSDYLKVRQQFGVPIGSFQVLQHRMADMAAECEMARSMLYAVLASIGHDDDVVRDHVVSQAKALIGRAARYVCGQAIQLHGGIGMTEECAVGHYFKRAIVADLLFGNSDRHEALCAAALGRSLTHGEDAALAPQPVGASR